MGRRLNAFDRGHRSGGFDSGVSGRAQSTTNPDTVVDPLAVTTLMGPLVAPVGTTALMRVEVFEVIVA